MLTTATVLVRGAHGTCLPSALPGCFLRTGPGRRLSPQNSGETQQQQRGQSLSSLLIPELGRPCPGAGPGAGAWAPAWRLTSCVAPSSLSNLWTPPRSECRRAGPLAQGSLPSRPPHPPPAPCLWFPIRRHDLTSKQISAALVMRCPPRTLYPMSCGFETLNPIFPPSALGSSSPAGQSELDEHRSLEHEA